MGIEIIFNTKKYDTVRENPATNFLNKKNIETIKRYLASFEEYRETPLYNLKALADELGVERLWVKDESRRFGLNAFKVLGGAYAASKAVCDTLGLHMEGMTLEQLKKEIIDKKADITLVTATDGNHGRSIAWTAKTLGLKAVVYMPWGSSEIRLQNIKNEGAEASITELNYDDSVRLAKENAEKYGWILVQDTAWEGYEEVPKWIMQGYAVIIEEIVSQLGQAGEKLPTHVLLQAGVGSFAGAALGYLVSLYGDRRPRSIIVEPDNAACIFESAAAGDGDPHAVPGDLSTIMAGLACGEPSTVSWPILRDYADAYAFCPDYVAARGMRILGNPLSGDSRIISGESGAVGLGLISILMSDSAYGNDIGELGLSKNSRILVISTEGDTDPENYRRVVWDGLYSNI